MRRCRVAAVVLVAIMAASCGGDSKSESSSSVSDTLPVGTVAPLPATTTTELVTTTTAAPVLVYPLTGLPVTDPVVAARPALVVKIDNNKAARPQSGLNEADIVFEEIVEVQTRFAIVLHSQGAEPVGPIRSGRTQDVLLLGSFNRPLFLWSGGNPGVTAAIEGSDLVNLSAQRSSVYGAAGFYRANDRKGPHDLYASSNGAWSLAPAGAGPPAQQFQYLAVGSAAAGDAGTGVNLAMDGLAVEWRFDAASGTYLRSNAGTPHMDALSGQVSTNNVVVMFVDYRPSAADGNSPEAQTIGGGEVWMFTGGVLVRGTWSRADRLAPITLSDSTGNPILLTPGRTFVELARVNSATAV
jgi:hypothetical protein